MLETSNSDKQQKINNLLREKEKMSASNVQFQRVNQSLKRKIDDMNDEKDEMKDKIIRFLEDM